MKVAIFIDGQRVDMFQDENITIVSSVLDIRDLTKNTTDFSNTFTLPASGINNKIFKHYYNADIDNSIDARTAIDARIEVHGITFRTGKITLEKVNLKKNMPESYVVNFFGHLLSLKKIIGSDKLSDLDTTEYDEVYEPDLIKALLTNTQTPYEVSSGTPHRDGLTCAIISSLRYWFKSYTSVYDRKTSANIWYDPAETISGIGWSELTPAIKMLYLIEQIETRYGITFSRGFLGTDPFRKLYMLLDNGTEELQGTTLRNINFDINPEEVWIKSYGVSILTAQYPLDNFKVIFTVDTFVDPIDLNTEYKLIMYKNGVKYWEETTRWISTHEWTFANEGDVVLQWLIEVPSYFRFKPKVEVQRFTGETYIENELHQNADYMNVAINFVTSQVMPDMQIMDFLKGIINAYKLVIIPDENGNIYLDTTESFYDSGKVIDVTKYIDMSSHTVSRGKILNKINYKFQEPSTILAKQFKGSREDGYGDESLSIYDENGELIEGDSQKVELPFEQMVYERLPDENGWEYTNITYGLKADEKLEKVHVKPHVFFPVFRARNAALPVGWKVDYQTSEDLGAGYFCPSHRMTDSNAGTAFLFGNEKDEYTGEVLTNNLYSEYYADYIGGLFNKKRRSYDYKAKNMPIHIINSIELNDVLVIRNNRYRINNYKANIITGDVTFNLYNISGYE